MAERAKRSVARAAPPWRGRWRSRLAVGIALLLPFAVSASLAFNPHMHHGPDCPMQVQNKGDPTALSVAVTTPPVVDGPIDLAELSVPLPAAHPASVITATHEPPRSRDPPEI